MKLAFSYPRYLEAKRSVDDRALNRGVLDALRRLLPTATTADPLRVLEIGGGTGSMVRRLLDWEVLCNAHYTLVDRDEDSLAHLPEAFSKWADKDRERTAIKQGEMITTVTHTDGKIVVERIAEDIHRYLERAGQKFDLVIAHAVLDLIDMPAFLPLLWSRCTQGAPYLFTINFDGESAFLPPLKEDEKIWHAYHESMDRRPGGRFSGRKLFGELRASNATILQAGSSDWIVHASGDAYEGEEGYFLHHIVHTIDEELRGAPPVTGECFRAWIEARHDHISSSALVYIAHQLDFVGTAPSL